MTLDEKQLWLKKGEAIDIPRGAVHRIENRSDMDMKFIEVQNGDYFGEDDIERLAVCRTFRPKNVKLAGS